MSQLRRSLWASTRTFSLPSAGQRSKLLRVLSGNGELTPEEARVELRWMEQETRNRIRPQHTKVPQRTRLTDHISAGGMSEVEDDFLSSMVERRGRGEPLQYILGHEEFGPIRIKCRSPTLIPRPETAHIVTQFAELLKACPSNQPFKILDLCSGTGCIPLLLADVLGPRLNSALGIDVSSQAICLAEENKDTLAFNQVRFAQMDLFDAHFVSDSIERLGGKATFITANPPYISRDDWQRLPISVRQYEDPGALIGDPENRDGGDGLSFYPRIAAILANLLESEEEMTLRGMRGLPRFLLEIGKGQTSDIMEILDSSLDGLRLEVWKDQFGMDRAVVGWLLEK